MYSLVFLALTSTVLALLLTPLVRSLAWRFGLLDQPDQQRKIHAAPTPRVGGVAIAAAAVLSYGLLLLVRLSSGHIIWSDLPVVIRLAPAFGLIFTVGLIDDVVSLPPKLKLAGQFAAALYAWGSGIHVNAFAGHPFDAPVTFVVTIFWIVLCTNAINLIDGVDGLAAGVSFFALLTMAGAALLEHNIAMALAAAPLAGAVLGFLRYNYYPASVFLGDSGSLTLGFLLGCFGALWSEKSTTLIGLAAPLLVLSVPILDVCNSVLRRFLRGRPLFRGDRAHIHHRLLAMGLGPRHLTLVVYGISALGSGAALLLTVCHQHYRGFVIVLVLLAALLGLQHLGYRELNVAGKVFFGSTLRSALSVQFALEQFEEDIRSASTDQQCCEMLCSASPQFGICGAVFSLDDLCRRWGCYSGWQARINFPGHGHINLWCDSDGNQNSTAAVLFIDSVGRMFRARLAERELHQVRISAHD